MKKIILSLFFIFLFTFIFISCGEKEKFEAPTLLEVYQDSNGNVLAKYSGYSSYSSPEFSFDAENWNMTMVKENNTCELLSYNSVLNNGTFTYRTTDGNSVSFTPSRVQIYLRQSATSEKDVSEQSNSIYYNVKVPCNSITFSSSDNLVIGTSHKDNAMYYNPNTLYGVAYSVSNKKYYFSKHSAKNVITNGVGDYTYDDCVEHYCENLEYLIVDSTFETAPTNEFIENYAKLHAGEFTSTYDGTINVTDANFYNSTISSNAKYCSVLVRIKETSTHLASSFMCVKFQKYEINYTPICQINVQNLYIWGSNNSDYDLSFYIADQSVSVAKTELLNAFYLTYNDTYNTTTGPQTLDNLTVTCNELGENLTVSDVGNTYSIVFKQNNTTITTKKIKIFQGNPTNPQIN